MLRKKYHVVRKINHVVRKIFYVASIFSGAAGRKSGVRAGEKDAVEESSHGGVSFFHGGVGFSHGGPLERPPAWSLLSTANKFSPTASMRLPNTSLFLWVSGKSIFMYCVWGNGAPFR